MEKIKTSVDFAQGIIQEIKQKEIDTSRLDYIRPADIRTPTEIYDTDFDVVGKLSYGGCEGIYIDIDIVGSFGKDPIEKGNRTITIITAKMLGTEVQDLEYAGKILADCVYVGKQYLSEHEKDYLRRGYSCRKPSCPSYIWVRTLAETKKFKDAGYIIIDMLKQKEI